jgi:CheY-like chemotaxis protein
MGDVAATLVRERVLTAEGAARALASADDGDVASAALRLGLADENALVRALCRAHGCPGVDLSRSVVPCSNLDVVAPEFCREHKVLPISAGRGELVLAMANPEEIAVADEVRFFSGRKVLRYVAVTASMIRTLDGLLALKKQGKPAWRGPNAPPLPDPTAAWVGVVKPVDRAAPVDVPPVEEKLELVGLAESMYFDTPFQMTAAVRKAPEPESIPLAAVVVEHQTAEIKGVGAGKVALVADDDAETRMLLSKILGGSLGCTVLQAANGRAALDIVREARPDLVVLDAMMPVLHGFDVCRTIKGDPQLRGTSVVLCSAIYRGTVAADAKVAFAADAFVEKPFRVEELTRILKVALLGAAAESAEERARRDLAARDWRAGAKELAAGNAEEAAELCRQATAQDPLSAEAHYYLGHSLSKLGLLFEAVAAYERAAELRPDVDAAHQYLAQTYEQLGFQRSARQAWARAVEACKDPVRRQAMQQRLIALLAM